MLFTNVDLTKLFAIHDIYLFFFCVFVCVGEGVVWHTDVSVCKIIITAFYVLFDIPAFVRNKPQMVCLLVKS